MKIFWLLILVSSLLSSLQAQETSNLSIDTFSYDALHEKVEEYESIGKNVEGLPYFFAFADSLLARKLNTTIIYPLIFNNITYAYELMGAYEKADSFYHVTLDLYEKIVGAQHPNYITQLSYYGDFLKVAGDYERAEPILKEALALAKNHKNNFENKVDYNAIFGFLGNFYRQALHEYEKALPLYLAQIPIYEKEIGEKHIEYGALLSNLGTTYGLLGQKEKALEMQKKAVEVTEKYHGKNSFQYGQRINNLALTYAAIGAQEEITDSLYLISIDNVKTLIGEEHPEYAFRLMNRAMFLYKAEAYQKAERIQKNALDIFAKFVQSDHPVWIRSSIAYSKILWYNGEEEKAKTVLLEAINYQGEEDFEFDKLHLSFLKQTEWLLEALNLGELIPTLYQQKNEYNTHIVKNQFDYFSEYEQLSFAKTLKDDFDRLESYIFSKRTDIELLQEGYDNQLLLKGLSLRNTRRLATRLTKADESTQTRYEEWQGLKRKLARQYALAPDKRVADFEQLVERANELESALARSSQSFKENSETATWTAVENVLEEGDIAIEFSHFRYYSHAKPLPNDSVFYVAYILRKGMQHPKMIPLFEQGKLTNLKKTKSLYQFDSQDNKGTLSYLIWEQLSKELKDTKVIYFAPSGILNRINLGAIPISETEILADRFELHQMGSTRQLLQAQQVHSSSLKDAVVFGGIQYEDVKKTIEAVNFSPSISLGDKYRSYRKKGWEYLEWTAQEASGIEKILQEAEKQVQTETADEADEATFKQLGKGQASPKIIHLATHGYFFPKIDTTANAGFQSSKNPLIRSGLILAGANVAWQGETVAEGSEDGILTAYEIAQMDLSNTDLVVLSACDTGLGKIEGDEGVYGLQRAFKIAGVKYILMSLWNVKDQKTYEFMTIFYDYLMEHDSIPDAYRFAQKSMQEKYDLPFNPRNWAGFVLVK